MRNAHLANGEWWHWVILEYFNLWVPSTSNEKPGEKSIACFLSDFLDCPWSFIDAEENIHHQEIYQTLYQETFLSFYHLLKTRKKVWKFYNTLDRDLISWDLFLSLRHVSQFLVRHFGLWDSETFWSLRQWDILVICLSCIKTRHNSVH